MEHLEMKPMYIAVGLAVGLVVLLSAGGKSGGAAAANSQLGLASQQIATSADVAYSHDQTTQALKAMDITLGVASLQAGLTSQNINQRAAVQMAAVGGMNAIVVNSIQADVANNQIKAGVTTALARNNTMITMARDQYAYQLDAQDKAGAIALKLQPGQVQLTQNLATISAETAKTIAGINSQTMIQLAQMNANMQQQRTLASLVSGAGGIPGIISSIGSIAGMFGGGGGVADVGIGDALGAFAFV